MTNTNTVNALPDILELPEPLANQVGEEYTNDAHEYVWLQIVRGEDDVKELVEDFIDGYELEPSADTSTIVTEFITHTMAIRRQQIAKNMRAVERRDRKHIENGKVHVVDEDHLYDRIGDLRDIKAVCIDQQHNVKCHKAEEQIHHRSRE